MKKIQLRSALVDDIRILQQIYRQTIDSACRADYDESQRTAWKRTAENGQRWIDAINGQYFQVAEIDGEIAGFGSLLNAVHIDFMYTASDFLGKGVAKQIYARLESRAVEAGTGTLTSDVSKTAAPFFKHLGFVVIRENINVIDGIEIRNYRMEKVLVPPSGTQ
ncbi:GNAT family N-acetyltransferase [Dyadobacter sp. 676]|uniref:GNAT family N-acetyltransferase n=1 Tax=Dyadobacter sp. 676 TaxID=3088362 RepID=A0AAU8FJ05_9BACT